MDLIADITGKTDNDFLKQWSQELDKRNLEILEYTGPFGYVFPESSKEISLFRKFFSNAELCAEMIEAYKIGVSTQDKIYGPEYFHFCKLTTCMALVQDRILTNKPFEHFSLVLNDSGSLIPVAGSSRKEVLHIFADKMDRIIKAFIIKQKHKKIKNKKVKQNAKRINVENIVQKNYIIRVRNEKLLSWHPVLNCISNELNETEWERKKLASVEKIDYFIKNKIKIYSNKSLDYLDLISPHLQNNKDKAQIKIFFKRDIEYGIDCDAILLALQQLNFENKNFKIINNLYEI